MNGCSGNIYLGPANSAMLAAHMDWMEVIQWLAVVPSVLLLSLFSMYSSPLLAAQVNSERMQRHSERMLLLS